jgi:hypothetical protein
MVRRGTFKMISIKEILLLSAVLNLLRIAVICGEGKRHIRKLLWKNYGN